MFETEIHGVACVVDVTHYYAGLTPITSGPADRWDPGDPAEVEYDIKTMDGHSADLLKKMMTPADRDHVAQQAIAFMEAQASYYPGD